MMREYGGMYYPRGERHMIEWCEKHGETIGGRRIYQAKKQRAAIEVCKTLGRTGLAIDIGAHIGHWSVTLADHFVQVLAFEPVEAHRACWSLNVLKANARLAGYALGDQAGHVHMQVEAGNSGNSSVRLDGGDVPMDTLDAMGFEGVDFIKIDVEGFEANVLRGGLATIERDRPVMVVEQKRDFGAKYGHEPTAAVDLLLSIGYRVISDMGGDFLCAHGAKARA